MKPDRLHRHHGALDRRSWLATAAGLAVRGLAGALPLAALGSPRVAWPSFTLLDGTQWSAASAEGRAVIVVFWSLYCPYCVRHNTHITKLYQESAGLPLSIITTCRDGDAQAVQRHMARHGHRFPVTLASAALAVALSSRRMSPLTVTVNRQGELVQVIPGEMAEDDVMGLAKLAAS